MRYGGLFGFSLRLFLALIGGIVLFSPSAWAGSGIDLGVLGKVEFTWEFLTAFLSIVLVDLVLAGDNAIVIALAVKNLPPEQKRKGIIFGAGAAVALRVALTFCVAQLLQVSFIKLAGGALVLWIAVKLLMEGAPGDPSHKEAASFWQAIRIIVIADIVMSTDNILAVAGACKGNFFLLLFGLALSIPFVVLTSSLLSRLMEKHPVIIYLGAAVLGRVGGEMMITDPFVEKIFHPSEVWRYAFEAADAVGVIVAAKVYMRWKSARRAILSAKGGKIEP